MKLKFNKDGWTDWIQHDHKGCPVVGWYVRCETDAPFKTAPSNYKVINERCVEGVVMRSGRSWTGGAPHSDIVCMVRYKVRKPLGASKLEEMLKGLPKVVDKELEST